MEFVAEKSERLDKFLAARHTKFSRTQWQRFIRDGVIKVNGNLVIKSGFLLKKGDKIFVSEKVNAQLLITNYQLQNNVIIEPEPDIPLDIVYEDKDIVAVNKPAGLLAHPTSSQRRHTLVNALVARYPEIRTVGENLLRPGIAHRLDKDTSGILVAAENQKAFFFLKDQFLKRSIKKKYLALVEGAPKKKEGVISFQIRPSKSNRLKKVAVWKLDTSGKKSVRTAETYFKVKEILGDFALLEVQPKTGRTHQIRVHLSAIGHPVVGDRLYGSRKGKREKGKELEPKRQMLHAYSLEFDLPSGKRIKLEAEMPDDMKSAVAGLKKTG